MHGIGGAACRYRWVGGGAAIYTNIRSIHLANASSTTHDSTLGDLCRDLKTNKRHPIDSRDCTTDRLLHGLGFGRRECWKRLPENKERLLCMQGMNEFLYFISGENISLYILVPSQRQRFESVPRGYRVHVVTPAFISTSPHEVGVGCSYFCSGPFLVFCRVNEGFGLAN